MILTAQGLKHKEIAGRLMIDIKTVDGHVSGMLANMGVKSSAQAVFKAIESGILNLDELTGGLNLQAVTTLTPSELEVLAAMANEHEETGRNVNERLAKSLFRSVATIEFHKTNIFKKFGVNNHIQAVLIYQAAKKSGLLS